MPYVTVKHVAEVIGTDAKSLRRFMRSHVTRIGGTVGVDTPGRGGRYAIDESEIDAIAEAFNAWRARNGGAMLFTLADDAGEEGDAE
jgi:hypothetical protein